MDVTKSNGFYEMTEDEMVEMDGGALPVLFVIWGIEVTVGHCLAAGAALGLTAGGALILN